jgi:hypothetical protein
VVAAANPSAGQAAELPEHDSATSHGPVDGRHAVVAAANPSAGQAAELPEHDSATSHSPADGRHAVVAAWNPSAGHTAELPVHDSATSHTPAEGRHAVVTAANPSAGHAAPLPVHDSATSHTPVEGRHAVVAAANAFAGHAAALPVHDSATSHGPSDGRHTVVAAANPSVGQAAALPVHDSVTSHGPADGRHAVVAAAKPSAGHSAELPVHDSATSHGPAAGRHTVVRLVGVHTPVRPAAVSDGLHVLVRQAVSVGHASTVNGCPIEAPTAFGCSGVPVWPKAPAYSAMTTICPPMIGAASTRKHEKRVVVSVTNESQGSSVPPRQATSFIVATTSEPAGEMMVTVPPSNAQTDGESGLAMLARTQMVSQGLTVSVSPIGIDWSARNASMEKSRPDDEHPGGSWWAKAAQGTVKAGSPSSDASTTAPRSRPHGRRSGATPTFSQLPGSNMVTPSI